ncbi:ubiquitin carboxyl-terminal hydrolase 36 isoform X2 [Toxorhynchites rutilus septentrionalis]|uniref:ubiquitin carboxyl-terminal hydrolase 36 isoform X2 n=1 Tax=Toxorhynchites rutilus septentrionalis TaxID=329112 RepID=UPI002478AFE2|nr:ubiquitin carboxyl-terminal hydrolase 36 isoform X2 [Toxorhynchites rutilus septentrionalis]
MSITRVSHRPSTRFRVQRKNRASPAVRVVVVPSTPITMRVLRLVKLRLLALYQLIARFLIALLSQWKGGGVGMVATAAAITAIGQSEARGAIIEIVNVSEMDDGGGTSTTSAGNNKDQIPTPKRMLFPRENVQLGWKASGRKWNTGAGMTNVGNTCYLNSTLQALFHVPAIANWLLSDSEHRERCDDNGQGACIICAMAKTLLASQNSQGAIKPHLVYSKLRMVCKHLVPGRQEDAHEFLRYLVEAMEKSYLGRIKNSKDLDQYSKETTPLNQILGGYLRSEVKCLSCQHISTTFQHFEDLLLDIRKVNSIEEALQVYFARERLEEMQYKCEACKKRVAATKQFSLERAPFALCIQLKRFSMLGGKITKHVELRSKLDLTPYSSKSAASNGKLVYKLASMVTHLGNTQHCGHYTAIGGTESGSYYVFDDSSVRPIAIQNVISTNAYIIFYELESVQNGMKTSASSTATLASYASATGSCSAKAGSNGGPGANTGGTAANSSSLSGNPSFNPLFSSKLENRSNFIGPVLPQQTTEKAKKLANGLSNDHQRGDDGETMDTAATCRLSPVSSTTSSLSTPSPVKHSGTGNLSSPSASKMMRNSLSQSPSSVKNKFGMTITPNGISNNNSNLKVSSKPSSLTAPSSLPSMPKLCIHSSAAIKSNSYGPVENGSPATKSAGFPDSSTSFSASDCAKKNSNGYGNKTVRLVPYDDDEEEDDEAEGGRHEKKAESAEEDDESDEDIERLQSHVLLGPGSKKYSQAAEEEDSSCSPKSPPVIKTKVGLWKVSDNRPQASSSSSSNNGSNSGGSANSSNNASPATSGNSSPSSYGHTNGNGCGPLASGYQTTNSRPQSNGFNGHNGNNHNRNNDVVNQLHKFSHRGYGSSAVRSWNGQPSNMDRELANERREERKRQAEDDRDTEMDRGRIKKIKQHPYNRDQRESNGQQQNFFQNYQNHQQNGGTCLNGNNNRKWNNCNGSNGFNGGKYGFYQNRGNNYYQNGNHSRNHNGFRNGRHGRNGFYNKSHHHHQRDNGGANGFHNR